MKQFTKISLVAILSLIGVVLTVMFRDIIFQAVGPAIGLFENGQPTPVAGTTVLFFWGMLVAMLPLLAVRLKWPARFHFQIRKDVNWKTVSPAIVAIIWAMSPQLWIQLKPYRLPALRRFTTTLWMVFNQGSSKNSWCVVQS